MRVSSSDKRELAERVLMRSAWVDGPDRELLEQVLGRGVRPRSVAAVSGVSVRTVQRRVAGLVKRLTDGDVEVVLRRHGQWPAETSSVALAVWVRGKTLRETAGELGMSLHRVRQEVQLVRGLLAAVRTEGA